jgi:hypothetical protein
MLTIGVIGLNGSPRFAGKMSAMSRFARQACGYALAHGAEVAVAAKIGSIAVTSHRVLGGAAIRDGDCEKPGLFGRYRGGILCLFGII